MSDLYQRNVFARAEWLRDNYLKSQFKGVQDVEFENFDLEDLRTRVIREEDDLRSEGGGSDDSGFGSNHQELKLDLSGLNAPKEKDQQI